MKRYGPWKFDRKALILTHKNGYEINVAEWKTSAEVLDWIFQVQTKAWNDPETMHALIEAIEDIIHPQSSLCSSGIEKGPIDVRKAVKSN